MPTGQISGLARIAECLRRVVVRLQTVHMKPSFECGMKAAESMVVGQPGGRSS
jgi:hypothetical protein